MCVSTASHTRVRTPAVSGPQGSVRHKRPSACAPSSTCAAPILRVHSEHHDSVAGVLFQHVLETLVPSSSHTTGNLSNSTGLSPHLLRRLQSPLAGRSRQGRLRAPLYGQLHTHSLVHAGVQLGWRGCNNSCPSVLSRGGRDLALRVVPCVAASAGLAGASWQVEWCSCKGALWVS